MGFWEKNLGSPQQLAAPSTVPSQGPWWAHQPTGRSGPPQSTQQADPASQERSWDGEHTDEEVIKHFTSKAFKARSNTASCPECGSANYARATPESYLKCYNCGHNDRFSHTGGGIASSPGATPAKQTSFGGGGGSIHNFVGMASAQGTLAPNPYANAGA